MAEKKLTVERSLADFRKAYKAKRTLIERQREDFLFRLGKQWTDEKIQKLKQAGIEPVTDNRIQPNIFLLTGLERQNRSDFKAFPEGEEDSIKAEIASALFKNSIKISDFGYKKSEVFEDGVTCGESNLELYLDNTYNLLNGKPCWKKIDSGGIFPEKGFKEYDYSDARYVYKLSLDLSQEDLCALYPEYEKEIEELDGGKLDADLLGDTGSEKHQQKKDYSKSGSSSDLGKDENEGCYDLLERYYKKFVEKYFVGDRKTGQIIEAESKEKAEQFKSEYQMGIQTEQQQFTNDTITYDVAAQMGQLDPTTVPPPPQPEERDPERYMIIKRKVPEIWLFAHVPGMDKPLADERAWFYPKWKSYPFIPYFAHFSTAPITGDDRHLLVQGIVHGVKGAQQMHNSMETLEVLYLNSSSNGGWLTKKDTWVDRDMVKNFGASPGVNLEYTGDVKPERIFPMQRSAGHAQIAESKAEAIKAQLGINADLLAVQEGSQSSGRAIALRQRQGLLMVQKLFDNLSRTAQICGKFLLAVMGDIYDTETAKKVLGDAFLKKNFPPPMELVGDAMGNPVMDPNTGAPKQQPMVDPESGQPMEYDAEMAEIAIAEVLSGDLGQYDVAVGESVASETMKLANAAELSELAQQLPGVIPPQLMVEESQLSQATKNRILSSIEQAQAAAVTTPPKTGQPGQGA